MRGVGVTVTVNGGVPPLPVRATVCGEPVALSEKEIAPVAVPVAVGLKSTETVQLAPAANVLAQVVAVIR